MINHIGKSSDEAGQSLRSFHDHWQQKMITGHYLGQLVRLESAKLIKAQLAHPSKDPVIGCGARTVSSAGSVSFAE
jgi:hypothetical protein